MRLTSTRTNANLARQRLAVLAAQPEVDPAPALASVRTIDDPHLIDALPQNDVHLIKARLLANAALNEYIRPEIQLSETSGQWGALAEAEIYQSFGEDGACAAGDEAQPHPVLSPFPSKRFRCSTGSWYFRGRIGVRSQVTRRPTGSIPTWWRR